jgi:hypothetical protein
MVVAPVPETPPMPELASSPGTLTVELPPVLASIVPPPLAPPALIAPLDPPTPAAASFVARRPEFDESQPIPTTPNANADPITTIAADSFSKRFSVMDTSSES